MVVLLQGGNVSCRGSFQVGAFSSRRLSSVFRFFFGIACVVRQVSFLFGWWVVLAFVLWILFFHHGIHSFFWVSILSVPARCVRRFFWLLSFFPSVPCGAACLQVGATLEWFKPSFAEEILELGLFWFVLLVSFIFPLAFFLKLGHLSFRVRKFLLFHLLLPVLVESLAITFLFSPFARCKTFLFHWHGHFSLCFRL